MAAKTKKGEAMKKLPEYVFVSWRDSNDGPWLSVDKDAAKEIEDDGPSAVGRYKLVEVNELTKRVTSRRIR